MPAEAGGKDYAARALQVQPRAETGTGMNLGGEEMDTAREAFPASLQWTPSFFSS